MKFLIMAFGLFLAAHSTFAQGVGINNTNAAPHPSAGLDVDFNDRGMLIPRLTETQRNAIQNPAVGLMIYNLTTNCLNLFDGAFWNESCFACSFTASASSNSPRCAGNSLQLTAGTVPGATYSWTGPNGFTSNLQNPVINNVSAANAGTYTLSISRNGCNTVTGTTNVVVSANPGSVAITGGGSYGNGTNVTLTATNVSGATYTWTGPGGFTASGNPITVSNFGTGKDSVYTVNVSVPGCGNFSSTTSLSLVQSAIFTSSGTFNVPQGVSQVRVLVVGGGGGGAGGHAGGGGSGHVRVGTYNVSGSISITVGTGGSAGNGGSNANSNGGAGNGTSSSFGGFLSASGGNGAAASTSGGNGGSGGGGGCNSGNPGGQGGSNGSNGLPGGGGCYGPGSGGNFNSLSGLIGATITGGTGGAGGTMSHSGGGGAGGVLINGNGPSGGDGVHPDSGKGGRGYGAAGGGGGYNNTYHTGGAGAAGVVYIEW